MKKEYTFAKGERGKFYRPDIQLNLPVYLEADVKKCFPDSDAVNEAIGCLLHYWERKKSSPRQNISNASSSFQLLKRVINQIGVLLDHP